MVNGNIKTRYLVIRLDITDKNTVGTFANGSTTKYIYGFSGSPLADGNSIANGIAYPKIDCIIQAGIGYQSNVASITIAGMSLSDINTFSRTNLFNFFDIYSSNLVTVYAGYSLNSNGLPPLIFCGSIIYAGPDFNNSRDRPFIIRAMQNYSLANTNLPPINIKGNISIDNLFRFICQQIDFNYRGYQVKGNAYNPILTGDGKSMLDNATRRYGYIYHVSTDPNANYNIVYIAPKGSGFEVTNFILSAKNGMIGSPVIETAGFSVRTYFNPSLAIGQGIKVDSITLDYINNKQLYINQMIHNIHNREDAWESVLQLNEYSVSLTGGQ